MQLRAEDRNKAIVLVVAIVAILGFAIYSLTGSLAKKEQVQAPQGSAPSTIIQDIDKPATHVEAIIPQSGADPFRKTVDTSPRPAEGDLRGSPQGSTAQAGGGPGALEGDIPGLEPALVKVRAHLDGVLIHKTGTAVFSIGDKTHYLESGDTLLNMKVLRVARGGVVVRLPDNARRWIEIGWDIDIPMEKQEEFKQ